MTDEQRDNLLLSMAKVLDNLNVKVNELSKLDEKVERYHQIVLKELERQRINIAKLENNLTEQIRALFDVREINNDKFEEHDVKFEDIDKTLDWHHRRILKLETTN